MLSTVYSTWESFLLTSPSLDLAFFSSYLFSATLCLPQGARCWSHGVLTARGQRPVTQSWKLATNKMEKHGRWKGAVSGLCISWLFWTPEKQKNSSRNGCKKVRPLSRDLMSKWLKQERAKKLILATMRNFGKLSSQTMMLKNLLCLLSCWNFSHLNTAHHRYPNWCGPHGVSCPVGTRSPKSFSSSNLQDETSQLQMTCFQNLHFKSQGSQEEFTQREEREREFRNKKIELYWRFRRTTWKFMSKTRRSLLCPLKINREPRK